MRRLNKRTIAAHAVSLSLGILLVPALDGRPVMAQTSPTQAGYDYLERGWVDDAIRQFQQAVRQQPQSVSAQLGLAIAYQRAGRDTDAWQAYQRVLSLDPANRRALVELGTLGGYRPEWQPTGINVLTMLLQMEPQNTEARAQRALLLGYQGRFVEAIADYEQLLANNPTPQTLVEAAQIYTYSGNEAEGLVLFERYLATGQSLTDAAAIAYAQTLQSAGRADEAVTVLNRRLQATSDSIELRAALATAYARNGQPELAMDTLAPLRDRPEAPLPVARALSRIARQTEDAALYRESIQLYQQALAATAEPSDGLMTEVADVLSEDPDFQPEALRLYDDLLTRSPDHLALRTKRLIVLNAIGTLSDAELSQRLLVLLQPLPDDAAMVQQIGQALIRIDNPDPVLLPIYDNLIEAGAPVDFLYFRLAQIQLNREDWTAAKAAIAAYQATPSGTTDIASALLLAELERRQGNFEASIQQYETIFSQTESLQVQETALLAISGIYQSQQRWEKALIAYERLLNIKPQSDRAQLGSAYLSLRLQQMSVAQAETVLETWLANYPTVPAAMVPPELVDLVGELPADANRQPLYETLLAIAPYHLGLNRRYAQVLAAQDPEAAIAYLNTLTPEDPADVDIYFVRGEVAQTLGELDIASTAYETILAQEPENVDAIVALGGVRFQQRRFAEAETLYEDALTLRPNDWDIRRILAELNLAQDEPITAFDQFEALQADIDGQEIMPPIDHRLQDIRLDFLRRRGFQPSWEQY